MAAIGDHLENLSCACPPESIGQLIRNLVESIGAGRSEIQGSHLENLFFFFFFFALLDSKLGRKYGGNSQIKNS